MEKFLDFFIPFDGLTPTFVSLSIDMYGLHVYIVKVSCVALTALTKPEIDHTCALKGFIHNPTKKPFQVCLIWLKMGRRHDSLEYTWVYVHCTVNPYIMKKKHVKYCRAPVCMVKCFCIYIHVPVNFSPHECAEGTCTMYITCWLF